MTASISTHTIQRNDLIRGLINVGGKWDVALNPQTYHGRIDRPSLEYSALGDTYSRVTASANTPLTGTATQPFVRVEAHTERVVFPGWSPGLVMWYVRTDGRFYAACPHGSYEPFRRRSTSEQ